MLLFAIKMNVLILSIGFLTINNKMAILAK